MPRKKKVVINVNNFFQYANPLFSQFNPELEEFEAYLERFECYSQAHNIVNGINHISKKDIFLACLSPSIYGSLRMLAFPRTPRELSFDEIISKLYNFLKPAFIPDFLKNNLISRSHQSGEPLSYFLAGLEMIGLSCRLSPARIGNAVQDQFIMGTPYGVQANFLQYLNRQPPHIVGTIGQASTRVKKFRGKINKSPTSPGNKPGGDMTNKMKCGSSPRKHSPQAKNLKRKLEPNSDGCKTPAKTMNLSQFGKSKNALCLLHEMYRGLDFKIVNQEGPVHAPTFTASVEINGIKFEGKGRNKKTAKHNAAEAALRSLVQFKNPSSEAPSVRASVQLLDFTSDSVYKEVNNFNASKADEPNIIIPNGESNNNGLKKPKTNLKPQTIEKNPVMLLNELHPNAKYQILAENGEQSCKYTMAVLINGKKFEEKGSSKKLTKAAVARSALLSFHNVSIPACPTAELGKPFLNNSRSDAGVPQVFSDNISRIINEKFISLMSQDPTHIRRKVLAGFVMSEGYDLNSCEVIAVATGTKCINGERMSVNGTVLNDSHAEIIARRCLCNFFYGELEKYQNDSKKDCIFEQGENGFRLKSKYKFHLYINSAPCGDSRIFSPYDEFHVDRHPNRKARGQLRTKIECGEGTIPVKTSDLIQTWDGVIQGERLLTMSCSDKIAKWNVVGLQGALLSNFIEPVYLDSIILGSLFHPHHLRRAVSGRIESNIQGLTPPYRLNEPKLATILNSEARQVGKAPNFSVNWTIGDEHPEIVNAVSGRTEQNQISRLSKCKLFYRFLRLLGKISSITDLGVLKGPSSYSYCKQSATKYQVAKKQLFDAFSKAKLGEWVKKPLEVDQFEWDEESLLELFSKNSVNGSDS